VPNKTGSRRRPSWSIPEGYGGEDAAWSGVLLGVLRKSLHLLIFVYVVSSPALPGTARHIIPVPFREGRCACGASVVFKAIFVVPSFMQAAAKTPSWSRKLIRRVFVLIG